MPKAALRYPGVFSARFDAAAGITTHEWLDYNPEDADPLIRKILDDIHRDFVATGSTKVLVVADRTRGAFSPEIRKFIEKVQFPRIAADTKLRFVATVLPTDEVRAAYAMLWRRQLVVSERFIQADFTDVASARAWLETMP